MHHFPSVSDWIIIETEKSCNLFAVCARAIPFKWVREGGGQELLKFKERGGSGQRIPTPLIPASDL